MISPPFIMRNASRRISFVLGIHHFISSANAFSPPSSLMTSQRYAFSTLSLRLESPTVLSAIAKTREAELQKLADGLGVSQAKVEELLLGQRQKLKGTEAKARHIDWLLNLVEDQQVMIEKSNTTAKKNKSVKGSKKLTNPTTVKDNITTTKKKTSNHGKDKSLLSDVEFAKRDDLHPATKRALIETLGLTSMTEIQSKTFDAALSGKDVLGRARTGTGKTIAFLLPAIERVLRSPDYSKNNDVGILIISPTRELASQIGDEADKLLTFHKDMTVQVVFGGTKVTRDVSRLKKRLPTVLVATPGRLKDLLQTANIGGGEKFSKIMSRTPVLVLDETDQLLDQGFRREIQQIINYLGSSRKRQTLLFSATVPPALKEIMRQTMEDDYVEVDCIKDGGKGEESTQTHIHVEQSHAIITSMPQYVPSIIRVVKEAVNDGDDDNKIVVFFPTARMVSFFADLFNEVVRLPVMELHSKKSQGYRNRVSGQFREATSGILFTSDVSARGVDYPGVTHVVQFGMPSSREQYIHRLGRTGRAGASGKGWLVLGPYESMFLEELTKINVPKNPDLIDVLNTSTLDETDEMMQELMERIQNGDQTLNKSGEGAYQAFLGYYLGQMKRMRMKRKERLVEIANDFSASMGFRETPALGKNMVNKMGLKGVAGLLVTNSSGPKVNPNIPTKRESTPSRTKPRWKRN